MALLITQLLLHSPCASAQQLPRENVIDIPAVSGGLSVSNVFQSGMVLQRDKPFRIWGWAEPGEVVHVQLANTRQTATAAADRRWEVTLPKQEASSLPITIRVASGEQTLELENILIGDLWLLGGQSNMEFELSKVENGALEIVSANFPRMRILTIPYGQGPAESPGFARLHEWSDWFGRHFRKGDWNECTPEVARELSAIGYVFARRVHMAANVPVGLIDVSRGGTTVETWTPLSTLRELDGARTQQMLRQRDAAAAAWDAEADLQKRVADHQRWLQTQQEQHKEIAADRLEPPTDLRPGPLGDHNFPGHCYAGMIAPLRGLSIKGILFHQGYNNALSGSAGVEMYREILPAMIAAWRQTFSDSSLPFCLLSLCTEGEPQTRRDYSEKMLNAGIEIRESQYNTFLDLFRSGDRNIGFVSTYDLRRRWYHPQQKLPAGERAARWALATQYGFERELQWQPPMIIDMKAESGTLRLFFDSDVGDPADGVMEGFAVAGIDRQFHPVEAAYAEKGTDNRGRVQYDRRQLVLSSPMVSEPLHYRYAWGRNPMGNIQKAGNLDLPLATQRSDQWRMEEVPLGVFSDGIPEEASRADMNRIRQALREQDRQRRIHEARLLLQHESVEESRR